MPRLVRKASDRAPVFNTVLGTLKTVMPELRQVSPVGEESPSENAFGGVFHARV